MHGTGSSMADSDVEEKEDESTLHNLSRDLLKREKQIIISSQSQNPSSNGWSMVIIKDYEESSIAFPPAHHENLHVNSSIFDEQIQKHPCESFSPSLSPSSSMMSTLSSENEDELNDSPSIPLSPMGSDEMAGPVSPAWSTKQVARPATGMMDWVCYGVAVLFRKVKGVLCSFPSLSKAAFTAVMVMGYLYFRQRRRTAIRGDSSENFNRIIREKDEKISQLLNQIARMNEVMLALPRETRPSRTRD